MMQKRTIYLDANIISYRRNWMQIEELISNHNFELILSLWNLYELSKKPHSYQSQIVETIHFLEKQNPRFVSEHGHLGRTELTKYIAENFLGYEDVKSNQFLNTVTELEIQLIGGRDLPKGYVYPKSMFDLVTILQSSIGYIEAITCKNQSIIQSTIGHDIKLNQDLVAVINKSFLMTYLPYYLPDNEKLSNVSRKVFLELCLSKINDIFDYCPSIAIDLELFKLLYKNKAAKVKQSDTVDIIHAKTGLAYCNFFVSNDGHLLNNIKIVKKRLPNVETAEPFRSLDDLFNHLNIIC